MLAWQTGYAQFVSSTGYHISSTGHHNGSLAQFYSSASFINYFSYPAGSLYAGPKFPEWTSQSETAFSNAGTDTVPDPRSVMFRSVVIPGWGQLTNRQVWKIPLIYGALAGITYYAFSVHNSYTDYRAAFYNTHSADLKFGPTPSYIVESGQPPQALQQNRDFYRNRRDFTLIGILLAYGLNVIDAYVFAHFRDFDVSDDLSAGLDLKTPERAANTDPSAHISFSLRWTF